MGMKPLPTALFGYVAGPLRWEGPYSYEFYESRPTNWVINEKPKTIGHGPVVVTHLQKESRFGFLLFSPFIFHFWFTFKFQEQDENGGYIPGTEKVFYFRTPGWRFDFADWKYITSKGYLGGHWD